MPKKAEKKVVEMKPANDPESREKQLINLAVNLAEKQLKDGSAPPSVINHFLKLASRREVIEREILEGQSKLIKAKTSAISTGSDADRKAQEAIDALRGYSSGSK